MEREAQFLYPTKQHTKIHYAHAGFYDLLDMVDQRNLRSVTTRNFPNWPNPTEKLDLWKFPHQAAGENPVHYNTDQVQEDTTHELSFSEVAFFWTVFV
jgi:hypothetical protein